jgi:hypothetical protein
MPETTAPPVDPTEDGTTTEAQLRWGFAGNQPTLDDDVRLFLDDPRVRAVLVELRLDAESKTNAAISADIDAIVKRLDEGIPQLNARLDRLMDRQRRPLTI